MGVELFHVDGRTQGEESLFATALGMPIYFSLIYLDHNEDSEHYFQYKSSTLDVANSRVPDANISVNELFHFLLRRRNATLHNTLNSGQSTSLEHGLSSEANGPFSHEIPMVHYRPHENDPQDPILNQTNPTHIFTFR